MFVRKQVEVCPPNPEWPNQFEAEAKRVRAALGETVIAIHHIGSTSIPSIYAKPIIDVLVEANDIRQVDTYNSAMTALGYEVMGEYGIPGRRYFRRCDRMGMDTHHIHVFEAGSSEVIRHLAFRDFIRAHPEFAQQYSDLKRQLAERYLYDKEAYMDGKDAFVKDMERRALDWRAIKE